MQPADRLHALDAVRASALLLGIVLHNTMPYLEGLQGWIWRDTPSATLAGAFFVIHMFRMPVFFLIAGFFGRMVLERRGTRPFVKDRAKRIVVPLVVGLPVVMIATGIAAVLGALVAGVDLTILAQQAGAGEGPPAAQNGATGLGLAHLWFLYYLLIFYTIVLVARRLLDAVLDRSGRLRAAMDAAVAFLMRGVRAPVLLAVPIAAYFYQDESWPGWNGLPAPFSVVPQAGALIGYGIVFAFGWLLHRQAHLLLGLRNRWLRFGGIAVALTVVCYTIAGPTPRWEPYLEGRELLVYSFAYMIAVWCWTFALVGAAVRYLSNASPFRRYIADSSYWLYLMHVPALAFFHVAFGPLDWHWSVKFVLSIAGALPVLFLSYHYLVRFTLIGATLNGRRRPRVRPDAVVPAAG